MTHVAAALGPAFVPLLPALVDGAPIQGNGLALLQAAITTIQPANSYLLPGLIGLAGGPGNLNQLDAMIGHIQPGNAWMLVRLLALVPAVADLDGLIQAAGVAHVGLLNR